MKRLSIVILISLSLLTFSNCRKSPKAVDPPEIVFTGISHTTVKNGDINDTLYINLRYTMTSESVIDKDDTLITATIHLRDSRLGDSVNSSLRFPTEINEYTLGGDAGVNISGNITAVVNVGLNLPLLPTKPNGDTMFFEIYLADKDSVVSNIVKTPDIYILP